MSETIMIPFVDPSCEVIKAYPFKLVIESDYFELYARYHVVETDSDTFESKELNVDTIEMVLKRSVIGLTIGRCVDYDNYLIKVFFGGRVQDFFFESKSNAMELYNKLFNWLADANS